MAEIDLSQLPKPDIIESLDYETILARRKNEFVMRWPASEREHWRDTLELESEPVTKLLQESAYMELLIRERINNSVHASMIAYAKGTDLDNLAANFGTKRLVIVPADSTATPPVDAILEDDESLRYRAQLAFEGITTAGPINSYKYHALSADGGVKDVSVTSPEPGTVLLSVLANESDGTANDELQQNVYNVCNAEDVRPLCDTVIVQSANIIDYTIDAELTLYPEVTASVTLDSAEKHIANFVANNHRIGRDITLSAIHHALHQAGVQNVTISQPAADIVVDDVSAAFCKDITISVGGRDE